MARAKRQGADVWGAYENICYRRGQEMFKQIWMAAMESESEIRIINETGEIVPHSDSGV
jgi:hypothetical protein